MKFYKYAPWVDPKGDYTRKNILNNAVYLASPETFNDPFDFNPVYDYNASEEQKIIHLSHLFRERENLTKKQARRKAKQILKENPTFNNEESICRFAGNIKNNLRQIAGVSCFTTKPGNSPMWAHYADGHTGICLEWDFPDEKRIEHFSLPPGADKPVPLILQPVQYSNERPVANLFCDTKQSSDPLYRSVITKSTDWAYENEYRLVEPGYTGHAYYEPYRLSGIIIGYKASQEQIQEIKKFITQLKFQPGLYKAALNEKNFDYDIIPLQ